MEIINSIFILFFVLAIPATRKAFFARVDTGKNNKAGRRGRIAFFDFAKGVAIIAVILIHAVYLFVEKYPDYNPFWLNTINNLSRFAVGFFFIASGALLTSGLTRKKLLRIGAPYLTACMIVGVWQGASVDLVVGGVFRGDLLPPYYFIPVLLQLYLVFPLLDKYKNSKYFLPATLAFSYLFYLTQEANYIFGVPFFGQYLFLFAFGVANSQRLKNKSQKGVGDVYPWLIIILIYVTLQFMLPEHYYNTRFFYAPAALVVLKWLWEALPIVKKASFVVFAGQLSLWIYLVHFPIEAFFVNTIAYNFTYPAYFYAFLITATTALASWVLAKVLSKIRSALALHS